MSNEPFEPSIREFDFPHHTVVRIAAPWGVDIIRYLKNPPPPIPELEQAQAADEGQQEMPAPLQALSKQAGKLRKYTVLTESVMVRMGVQFFSLPSDAVEILRNREQDAPVLDGLFKTKESTVPCSQLMTDVQGVLDLIKQLEEAIQADDLEQAEVVCENAAEVYGNLIKRLKPMRDVIIRWHLLLLRDTAFVKWRYENGIPRRDQKGTNTEKYRVILQWIAGLPSVRGELERHVDPDVLYNRTMSVPITGFTLDDFKLYNWESQDMIDKEFIDEVARAGELDMVREIHGGNVEQDANDSDVFGSLQSANTDFS